MRRRGRARFQDGLGKVPPQGVQPRTELGQAPRARPKSRLDAPGVPRTELGKVPGQQPGPGKTELGARKIRKSQLAEPGTPGKTEMRRAAGQPAPFDLSDELPVDRDPMFLGDERDSTDFDLIPTGDGSVQVQSDQDFSLELPEEPEQVGWARTPPAWNCRDPPAAST